MRKKSFFTALFMVFIMLTQAQVFTLSNADHPSIDNGSTVYIYGAPEDNELTLKIYIKNNDEITRMVKVRKKILSLVPGSKNTFCWVACNGLDIEVSPIPLLLEGGITDYISFAGRYYPNKNAGTSRIAYTFFDTLTLTDTVMVIAEYVAACSGIEHLTTSVSRLYPNPASWYIWLNPVHGNHHSGYLGIYSLTGNEIKRISVTDCSMPIKIDTGDLPSGVYQYILIVNNEILDKNKLFIIR